MYYHFAFYQNKYPEISDLPLSPVCNLLLLMLPPDNNQTNYENGLLFRLLNQFAPLIFSPESTKL